METQELIASLALTQEAAVTYTDIDQAQDMLQINWDTRAVTIPKSVTNAGVKNDHLSKKLVFSMDRYVCGVDLANHTFAIHFINVDKWDSKKKNYDDCASGVYPVTNIDLSVDGKVTCEWEITNAATQVVGDVVFALHVFTIVDSAFTYHLGTTPTLLDLLDTVNATEHGKNITPDEIEVYIQKMADLSAEIDAKVAAAEAAATRAEEAAANFEVDDTLRVAGKAADAAATGAKLSQLSSENAELKSDLDTLNQGGLNLKEDFIGQQVNGWLDEHPEATTTVQDGAITEPKIHADFLPYIKNEYVTPEMFGAVGDGSTDDSDSIKNAILFASSNKIPLYFLQKRYFVSKEISISNQSGIEIYGNGFAKHDLNYTLPCIINNNEFNGDNIFKFDNCNKIYINGLSLQGTSAIKNGIYIGAKTSLFIENCNIANFNVGLYLFYPSSINKFYNNNIGHCHCGIYGLCVGDSQFVGNYINGCGFDDASEDAFKGTGIYLGLGSSNNLISGGKIEYNAKGIYVHASSGIIISNINFDHNSFSHIVVTGDRIDNFIDCKNIGIYSNYFRSGGLEEYGCHIMTKSQLGNVKLSIVGNTFIKEKSNEETEENGNYGPIYAVFRNRSQDNGFTLSAFIASNQMTDGSLGDDLWLDGFNATVYFLNNITNLPRYVINNNKVISDAKKWNIIPAEKTIDLTTQESGVHTGSFVVDISKYSNAYIIPLGGTNGNDKRFCDTSIFAENNTVYVYSKTLSSAYVRYLILYIE